MKKTAILSALVLVLAGCFNPWQGDKGTFTVSIGTSAGNGRTAVPWNENYLIENLTHEITLSGGPGPNQTKEVEGIQTLTFTVTPGRWNISVEAYALSNGSRILIAVGSRNVDIKPGLNETVTITMGQPVQEKPPIEGMEWIPAGTFMMYSTQQEFQVTLTQGFYMGKYPVTQAEYESVMGVNPSSFNANPDDGETQGKRPVESVSWYDALVFCNKLSVRAGLAPAYSINESTDPATWGNVPTDDIDAAWNAVVIVPDSNGYRLPTEAQWEYACRAGTTTKFNNGNDDYTDTAQVGAVAWYAVNSNNKTHEVGLKAPNAWGLYDMHGNVSEWCRDWYKQYNGLPQTDPTGGTIGVSGIPAENNRIKRGGSWRSENGSPVSSDSRSRGNTFYRDNETGFRLVLPSDGVPVANYDDEDFGQGATINNTFNVSSTTEWDNAVTEIKNGGTNKNYIINVTDDFPVKGGGATFGTAATNIKVSLRGVGRILTLSVEGYMISLTGNSQTVIMRDLTLKGINNNNSLVHLNGTNSTFTMHSGKISDNTSNAFSGGVYIQNGTFTMNDGEISGNKGNSGGVHMVGSSTNKAVFIMNGGKITGNTGTSASYGGGVYMVTAGGSEFTMNGGEISDNEAPSGGGVYMNTGTFTMYGGKISGNKATGTGGGGGVRVLGTYFRIVTGTIYGSNEPDTILKNTTNQDGAALKGNLQYGTYDGDTWVPTLNGDGSNGELTTTDDTIKVVNGVLQQ